MPQNNTNVHFHPPFHWGWGGFAEELFYHTSRYYFATEIFLRNIVDSNDFSMASYKAQKLSDPQRELMAAVLSHKPNQHTAGAVISIVTEVVSGAPDVDEELVALYLHQAKVNHHREPHSNRPFLHGENCDAVPPLDPFLNISERLQLPVAIRGHHVEVSLHLLAKHLDSPNSALRSNLQNAVLQLHNAGYILRNHPHLTHMEAIAIADGDPV